MCIISLIQLARLFIPVPFAARPRSLRFVTYWVTKKSGAFVM